MHRKDVWAAALHAVPTVGLLIQGLLYVTTSRFVPYHGDALEVTWEALAQHYQAFILGVIKGMGAGSIWRQPCALDDDRHSVSPRGSVGALGRAHHRHHVHLADRSCGLHNRRSHGRVAAMAADLGFDGFIRDGSHPVAPASKSNGACDTVMKVAGSILGLPS